MSLSHRLDPLELDVAPDEAPPDYDATAAPQYEEEDSQHCIHSYHLRQVDRKTQILVPFGPAATTSYKILTQSSIRLFSKKPDMQLIRTSPENALDDIVASIQFDNDGPLPWRPRARFSYVGSVFNGAKEYTMESRNFADWTVTIDGVTFEWRLGARPISLVLSEKDSSYVIARFTYSSCGTLATNGAEAGELTIYRDQLSRDRDGVEKIICGVLVSLLHFKKMGRHYRNDGQNELVRGASLTSEFLPAPRVPVASHSDLWDM